MNDRPSFAFPNGPRGNWTDGPTRSGWYIRTDYPPTDSHRTSEPPTLMLVEVLAQAAPTPAHFVWRPAGSTAEPVPVSYYDDAQWLYLEGVS